MTEKRYHVFISSTYNDLHEERWEVAKVLLSHGCFVSGMEYFPSTGDEQFEYIKEVIDECDYYILILGGRYGSLAPDGVGYTEKEYNYALEKGMKPIAFVFNKPNDLPSDKRERDPVLYDKFCAFRERVLGKLSSLWGDMNVLKVSVSESIARATKRNPAIGWVRGSNVNTEELLYEIFQLKKELDCLKNEKFDFSLLEKDFSITFNLKNQQVNPFIVKYTILFDSILYAISYHNGRYAVLNVIHDKVIELITEQVQCNPNDISFDQNFTDQIFLYFQNIGLIDIITTVESRNTFCFISLTERGKQAALAIERARE